MASTTATVGTKKQVFDVSIFEVPRSQPCEASSSPILSRTMLAAAQKGVIVCSLTGMTDRGRRMDGRRMEAEPVQGRTFVIKLLWPPLALAGSAVLVAFKKIDFALLKQSLTQSLP